MPTKQSKPPTGAAYRARAGLKPIGVDLHPEVHALVRSAAGLSGVSMAEFARKAIEAAARKVLADKGL